VPEREPPMVDARAPRSRRAAPLLPAERGGLFSAYLLVFLIDDHDLCLFLETFGLYGFRAAKKPPPSSSPASVRGSE
jgi:hypothetical protein